MLKPVIYRRSLGSCRVTGEETSSDLLAVYLPAITDEFQKDGHLIHTIPGMIFLDDGFTHLIVVLDAIRREVFINWLRNEPVEEVVIH